MIIIIYMTIHEVHHNIYMTTHGDDHHQIYDVMMIMTEKRMMMRRSGKKTFNIDLTGVPPLPQVILCTPIMMVMMMMMIMNTNMSRGFSEHPLNKRSHCLSDYGYFHVCILPNWIEPHKHIYLLAELRGPRFFRKYLKV